MIISSFKIISLSLVIIFILSININQKPAFYYINEAISPLMETAQKGVENFFQRSLHGTKIYSKKIFENSVPKVNDSIKSKLSSHRNKDLGPLEEIKTEEKAELDELIRKY